MNEYTIKFLDELGKQTATYAKVSGKKLTPDILHNVIAAVKTYKDNSDGDWDTEGCLDVINQLKEWRKNYGKHSNYCRRKQNQHKRNYENVSWCH